MFTGIVEEQGKIQEIRRQTSRVLKIGARDITHKIAKGSSVAVNGVCLTVTRKGDDFFEAEVMPETWGKTMLSVARVGQKVNLESSLRIGKELGGHMVMGHVDGLARIKKMVKIEGSYYLHFIYDLKFTKYLADKGSVTLNGVSLTIVRADMRILTVSITPFTYRHTNLGSLKPGEAVNLEVDIVARYLERLARFKNGPIQAEPVQPDKFEKDSDLYLNFLRRRDLI